MRTWQCGVGCGSHPQVGVLLYIPIAGLRSRQQAVIESERGQGSNVCGCCMFFLPDGAVLYRSN